MYGMYGLGIKVDGVRQRSRKRASALVVAGVLTVADVQG